MEHVRGIAIYATLRIVLTALLALCAGAANAAPVSINFAGFLQNDLTDNTNYFGLGNTISAGSAFSLTATFDPTIGTKHNWVPQETEYLSQCCEAANSTSNVNTYFELVAPGPSQINVIELTLNGRLLSLDASLFSSHQTRIAISASGANGTYDQSQALQFNGTNDQGGKLFLLLSHDWELGFPPSYPQTTAPLFETMFGSISLLLLASDGTPLVDLAGSNFLGAKPPIDTPLPAALTLFALGAAGLGALSKRKR